MASVERLDAAQPVAEDKQNLRKVVAASFIGTTIEWYDFFLYGTAAALVFGELFFPGSSPLMGTLAAFGTFAAASPPARWAASSSVTSETASAARRCSSRRCSSWASRRS